ncbi:MAG: penicillin-binding protein activator [Myxococcales bacterium]|nr:penicillin-binding protein activator [Myxococcales bacterium]
MKPLAASVTLALALLAACGSTPPPVDPAAAPPADPVAAPAAAVPPPPPPRRSPRSPSASPRCPPPRCPEAVAAAEPAAIVEALTLLDPRSAAAGWVTLRLGRLAAHRRDLREARALLDRAVAVGGAPAAAAQETLDRLAARERVQPGRIGVLLPLSGPYAAIGETALHAVRLALGGVAGVELVVGDTAGDADRAPQIVEDMVQRQHVAAIIGPVGSIESHTAARAAERLEVPIVVLSSRADLTRLGTFVFRHRLTRSAQAEAIGRYAVEALGLKTFAILYPRTDYGIEMMQAFWQTVTRLGGEIRGAEGYSVNVADQNEPIKKLIGRHHLEARQVDPHWEALNRKSKDRAQHVPPVVDFEALFIPDGGQRVRLMLPFLAYWDIEVKNDPALSPLEFASKYAGDTPQLVQILGASGFNDPRLTRDPPTQALNALFVDAFWTESAAAAPFVEAWVAEHGRPPPVLAAHAYDAAKLLARVVPGATDRDAVRRALVGVGTYDGVFGPTRVGGDGEIELSLQVLTIDPLHGVVPAPMPSAEEPAREGYFDEDAPRN